MRRSLVWTSFGVLVIILLVMFLQATRQTSERYLEKGPQSCEYNVIFFSCPECEMYRPEWDRVVKFVESKFQGQVCTQEYPSSNRAMSEEYVVNGYPTIVIENASTKRRVTYDGQTQKWTAFGIGVFDNTSSIRCFFSPHINITPIP